MATTVYLDYAGLPIAQSLGALVLQLGTAGNDSIVGSSGRDAFQASAGVDTLIGAAGDDTYIIQNSGAKVVEAAGGGIDTVKATTNYILPDNVENLYIWGYTPKSGNTGVGNNLANLIIGDTNTQNFIGRGGNDVLVGGGGSDTFVFAAGSGHDVITDFTVGSGAGVDYVRLQDYALTTFDQVKAAMTQVGADVVLKLSSSDDITFRGVTKDAFVAGNFNLPIDLSKYSLTFADEFNTLRLQTLGNPATGTWAPEFGFGGFGSKASHYIGYYTGEQEIFVDPSFKGSTNAPLGLNPFSVQDGVLSIHARATTDTEKAALWPSPTGVFEYVSGMISNVSTFSQTYGYFEMRAKMPTGQGAWPCFWLVSPDNSTEVDILEVRGQLANITNTTLHESTLPNGQISASPYTLDAATSFHNYGLLWDKDYLVWYIDGAEVFRTATPASMNTPMYLVATLAVGAWAGTPEATSIAASTFDIDYIHAYSLGQVSGRLINGTAGADSLLGGEGADTLNGGAGADTLNGGAGADSMVGGSENDTYIVDHLGDKVVELVNEGLDTVKTTLAVYALTDNVENLTYTGALSFAGSGNALGNAITGGAGNDTLLGNQGDDVLIGAGGDDVLQGGIGNDTYVVDSLGDSIVELANEGLDLVKTGLSTYTLTDNVESLTYIGGVNFAGSGNALANLITGGAGADTLDGAAGADSLVGGLGDDLYVIDNIDDVVIEAGGGGFDTVQTSTTWTATPGSEIERIVAVGAANLNLTGNGFAATLEGNAAVNTLDDGGGADTLKGLTGDDTYVVHNVATLVVEAAGGGADLVKTDLSTYALTANVENLTYLGAGNFAGVGNDLGNAITGGAGNDTLTGGGGDDTLVASGGLDVSAYAGAASRYLVTSDGSGGFYVQDTLAGAGSEGKDHLLGVEWLKFSDGLVDLSNLGSNLSLVGTAGADTLVAGAGADTLDGAAGADSLVGGMGGDLYIVDNAGDVVVEAAGGGFDTVQTSKTWTATAGSEIERIVATGATGINLTGNGLVMTLEGNAAANTLDDGGGSDTLKGVAGNDTYLVHNAATVVVEALNEGSDTVKTDLSAYVLTDNVESLTYTGTGTFTGLGNALANVITGGVGNDTLDGGAGAVRLVGGLGDDTYYVDSASDTVIENAGEGYDTQVTTLVSAKAAANIEALIYSGTAAFTGYANATGTAILGGIGADTLSGGAAADTLDGGAGADYLAGAAGDDVYVIDSVGDKVIESAGAGFDTVRTALTSYTLGAEIEALVYTGATAFAGTGNSLANKITGGLGGDALSGALGDDTLDGGAGNDTLIGGAGNDVYIVSDAGDVVVEAANGGSDTVQISVTWAATLGSEIERIVAVGAAALNLTGNAFAMTLEGNGSLNTLDDGGGADTLKGLAGNDIYIVHNTATLVIEAANEGSDGVKTDLSAYALTDNVESLAYIGGGSFTGTGNALANAMTSGAGSDTLTGNGGDDTLDGGSGVDSLVGGLGDDLYIIDNAGDAVIEAVGGGFDTVQTSVTWAATGGSAIERVVATGVSAINLTGNLFAMTLEGNAASNTLDDGGGADTLKGLSGDDIYGVHNVGTVVVETAGGGVDLVRTDLSAYTLTDNVETLTYIGAGSFAGTGNALANGITGGAGNDTLTGGGGDDDLLGGGGVDVAAYVGPAARYVVTPDGAGGFYVQDTFGGAGNEGKDHLVGVEWLQFTDGIVDLAGVSLVGTANSDTLTGGAGNDTLDGAAGADLMVGGASNDLYIIDNAGDGVVETVGGGFDTVQTSKAWTATAGSEIERIVAIGTTNINLTGNAFAMALEGNVGINTLDDGGGADTLKGMAGNDTYMVHNAATLVVEAANAGTDLVKTDLSAYLLTDNVETLTYIGAGNFTGMGNALANVLTGGAGNDTLDGGIGADRLVGGLGDDTYYVDNASDMITETAGEGYDTQITSLVSAKAAVNVEALIYSGTLAFTGYAGATSTAITGGVGADTLNGGVGDDTLGGGAGNDYLSGGAGADVFRFDGLGLGVDKIADFQVGIDHIALKATGFGVTSLADLTFASGVAPHAIDNHAALLYDTSTGALYFDANGGDGADKVQIATLANKAAIHLSDFGLV